MAFPTYTSVNTTKTTGTTSHTMTIPSGIVTGDLMIGLAAFWNSVNIVITWPSGWTKLFETATTNSMSSFYYKWAGASESNFTVTTDSASFSCCEVLAFKQAHGSTAPAISTESVSSGTTPNPPSLTLSTWSTEDTLWFGIASVVNGTTTYSAAPANYGNLVSQHTNGASGTSLATADRPLRATTEDPGAFTSSPSTAWRTYTMAVRPLVPISVSDPPFDVKRRKMQPLLVR